MARLDELLNFGQDALGSAREARARVTHVNVAAFSGHRRLAVTRVASFSAQAGGLIRRLDDEFCPCKFEAIVSGPYSLGGGGTWSIPSKVSRAVNVVENVIDED